MACLIKAPANGAKGVLALTTQERDRLVFEFKDVRQQLGKLKEKYLIGLHHNWHDYSLNYDDLFDFHLAGEGDLREANGRAIPLVPMDACNFSPDCFQPGFPVEKFWDVLFVARAVEFKGIPEFFAAIRRLYDSGRFLRVLFICPVPPDAGPGSMRDVRKLYESMFHGFEQEKFTLLTTDFRYPFPFDLPTLSRFYRSSRIFVHSAPDERRCRVAAYAWASGLPVVGMAPVGSVLTPGLRHSPYFFEISSYDDFPEQIARALEVARSDVDFSAVQAEVASAKSVELFESHIAGIFSRAGVPVPLPGGWLGGLDIRLGRHHGLPAGVNRLDQDITGFFGYLLGASEPDLRELANCEDPEFEIARVAPCVPRSIRKLPLHKSVQGKAMSVARSILKRFRR